MKPDFSVTVSGENITELLRDRMLTIRTTDRPGIESVEQNFSTNAWTTALEISADSGKAKVERVTARSRRMLETHGK